MENILLNLKNINKNYGNQLILNNINLTIEPGKIYVIMGPSGSGKSTLLNIISLIENPTSGDYFWKGLSVKDLPSKKKNLIRRDNIGLIFQDFNLFEELTAFENLDVYLQLTTSLDEKQRKTKITIQSKNLDISSILYKKVKFLSGGERQRVTIARCYLNDTELILADEPSANIDSANKTILISSFLSLRQAGKTIVIVTHDDSYISLADIVYNLRNGELSQIIN
ncbi:ABC transporter ATP-binding protein [Clostridium carnis]